MSVMRQYRQKKIRMGEDNNALVWLVIINAVLFAGIGFIKIIYLMSYDKSFEALQFFHTQILNWFILPADKSDFFSRPWTILTYMFTQESVLLLISSLLWLWGFGYILQDLSGNNKLVPVYLYGGVSGGILFLLASNILPAFNQNIAEQMPLLGAGASVMAVAIAVTTLSPNYKIFPMINGGIPLWVLTLVYVAIDYVSIGGSSGPVAIAHLAGGTIGFIYTRQLQKGNDMGKWMQDTLTWIDNLFNPEKKKIPAKEKHFYKATRAPFEKKTRFSQQRLDDILDKINQDGYHFLSDEEKDFLKKASTEDF